MKEKSTSTFFFFIIGALVIVLISNGPFDVTLRSLQVFFSQSFYEILSDPNTLLGIIVIMLIFFFAFAMAGTSSKKYLASGLVYSPSISISIIPSLSLNQTQTVVQSSWNPFSFLATNMNEIILFCIILLGIVLLLKMFEHKGPH